MKEQLTQSNVLGMIGYLGSDFNISISIDSLLSIILDFENKCGFLVREHSLRIMETFFEKDPEGYRLDPQQNLHFGLNKEHYRQNYFSDITAANAVYLPDIWDIIKSKGLKHELDKDHIEVRYVQGVEGNSVWLNDIRIGGPKPWGGGKTLESFTVSIDDIKEALKNYL